MPRSPAQQVLTRIDFCESFVAPALSPDGRFLAVLDVDADVTVWDTSNGDAISVLLRNERLIAPVRAITLTADAAFVAVAVENVVVDPTDRPRIPQARSGDAVRYDSGYVLQRWEDARGRNRGGACVPVGCPIRRAAAYLAGAPGQRWRRRVGARAPVLTYPIAQGAGADRGRVIRRGPAPGISYGIARTAG